jgi:DNA-binding transcriptional LysR family regulator
MMEMGDAAREIDDFTKGSFGKVSIGAVTAPALDLVLPAVRAARLSHPDIQIEVTVTSSDILFDQLLSGKLDFMIARIPAGADAALVDAREIANEPVDLVVRKDHPLTKLEQVTLHDVMAYDWVLPNATSPLTAAVLQRLASLGFAPPRQRLSTASFLLTLALLQQSNAIAPLASAVTNQFVSTDDSAFVRVNIALNIAVIPYSLITRKDALLPRAAQSVLGLISQNLAQKSGSISA